MILKGVFFGERKSAAARVSQMSGLSSDKQNKAVTAMNFYLSQIFKRSVLFTQVAKKRTGTNLSLGEENFPPTS